MQYHFTTDDELLMVMYGYCVRYTELKSLINYNFAGSNANEINLFIDATDISYRLGEYIKKNKINIDDPMVFASGLINIAAHYRAFFLSRYRVYSKIWIIYNQENLIASKYHACFGYRYISKTTKEKFQFAVSMAETACKMIPDVSVEITCADFVTKALSILRYEKSAMPSIFITKDEFAYQVCMFSNMYVLRPKKSRSGEDISKLVHKYAVDNYIADISRSSIKSLSGILNTLIHPVMALSRVPSRCLPSVYRTPQAVTLITSAIFNQLVSQSYPWDKQKFFETIPLDKKMRGNINLLIERFNACDAVHTQLAAYESTAECLTYNGIVNIYDPANIKSINEEYFKKFPLNLEVF